MSERINQNQTQEEAGAVTSFPQIGLPGPSFPLMLALDRFGDKVAPVVSYLYGRGDFYLYEDHESRFWWSSDHPTKLLMPFFHYRGNVVGYLMRDIYQTGPQRFQQKSAPDYLFNQHLLRSLPGNHVLVMESPMSAIPLKGLATRSARITSKQRALLKSSGKKPILIPDYHENDWESYLNVAEEENWLVSAPLWTYKDIGEAMQDMGCLCALKIIMEEATVDYGRAKNKIQFGMKKRNG